MKGGFADVNNNRGNSNLYYSKSTCKETLQNNYGEIIKI